MKLTMIAAIDRNRLLGRADGSLPWKDKEEMAWFKKNTDGALVMMGRNTFESMGSRGLKGRMNLILSSRHAHKFTGPEGSCSRMLPIPERDRQQVWVHSMRGALSVIEANVQAGTPAFVIGGAQVYREAFAWCTDLFLTRMNLELPQLAGDILFPDLPGSWAFRGAVHAGENFTVDHWVQDAKRKTRAHHEVTSEVKAANWRAIQSGRDLLHELEEARKDIVRKAQCKTVEVHINPPRRGMGDPGFCAGDTLDWS